MKTNGLTLWVIIALVLGIAVGYAINTELDAKAAEHLCGYFAILTDMFLRMIKMVIGPLIFSTLVHGIASSDTASLGRVALKAMIWFVLASVVSLAIGLLSVNLMQPGTGHLLDLPVGTASIATNELHLSEFITHMIPKSFFEAMSNNEVLQIVIFSLFFGVAIGQVKGKAPTVLIDLLHDISRVMLKVTGMVMWFAPLGVFGAVASTIGKDGLGILTVYAHFFECYIVGLVVLWVALIGTGYLSLGRGIFSLMRMMRAPILLSFATASSEAAYPRVLEQLEAGGVSNRVAGFVLPLGYSFNLAGSVLYSSIAALFIAQVYDVPLTLGTQITLLLVLFVTSKGIAGVPRSSLVVVAAVLPMFNLPEAGVLLLLGVDHFMDMFRAATNVMANAIATTVVAQSEGEIHSHSREAEELGDAESTL